MPFLVGDDERAIRVEADAVRRSETGGEDVRPGTILADSK